MHIFFYYFTSLCFFIYLLDRGLDTIDESYSLLYSLYNKKYIAETYIRSIEKF